MKQTPTSISFSLVLVVAMSGILASTVIADDDRDQKQAELDAACEQAREQRLAPLRDQFVEECVHNEEQDSREACEAFYSDYGAKSGGRAPLFYDLPECVKAFNFQSGAQL